MTGILTVSNLTKIYKGKEAIQNVSFAIKKGDRQGLYSFKKCNGILTSSVDGEKTLNNRLIGDIIHELVFLFCCYINALMDLIHE